MARGKNYINQDERRDHFQKIEKIKKEKRSVRGRNEDDWIVDSLEQNKSKIEIKEYIKNLLKNGMRRGRVIEVQKRNIFIAEENEKGLPETENLWLCSVAKRHFQRAHKERNFVVVGDRILFEPDSTIEFDTEGQPLNTDLPRGVVQHSFARTSKISRKDPMHPDWEHVMLANIDLVVIVASVLNPEVRWGLVDRFLVQAELEQIPAVIVLNKVDLLTNTNLANAEFLETYKRRVEIYRNIGYEVVEICALKPKKTPESVKQLRRLFKGKLVGFAGHSGVGKSSILNLMRPEFEQIVDENPEIFYKGRHTTTYNSLLQLDIGAYAIDTPGIRSFNISQYDAITLSHCFPEFRPFKCKYRECSHDHEPSCGVKEALAETKISYERYRSYLGILKGLSFREGEGDSTDAGMIADLKARVQMRDEEQLKNKNHENIGEEQLKEIMRIKVEEE
ncbi:ribosome small subunit-dependent GTPase A [Fluviispira multicolorata]|uniref:Small ribosomal subunit biogenesis GTPase RsgA n=1 Tax=Fluviispira multicolorata TaxID=2654512 RepID=A0A833N669_9BACT|nr:ribosome small subunit-dependent GTPase A [Fluviispira multicolorata]KAB8032184.1 ribosome small subunit-dependent GTPase A [Fluviispira multicolorata]